MKKLIIGITLLLTSALAVSAAPIFVLDAPAAGYSEIVLFSLATSVANYQGIFDPAGTFLFASQIFPTFFATTYREGIYPCQNGNPFACPFDYVAYNDSLNPVLVPSSPGNPGGSPSAPEPSTALIVLPGLALVVGATRRLRGR